MVKLTPELIEQCASYTNPVKDREIDFRGEFSLVRSNCCQSFYSADVFVDMCGNDRNGIVRDVHYLYLHMLYVHCHAMPIFHVARVIADYYMYLSVSLFLQATKFLSSKTWARRW